MTRMTRPDCAVMCNLINIHTYIHIYIYTYIHTYIYTYIHIYIHTYIHVALYFVLWVMSINNVTHGRYLYQPLGMDLYCFEEPSCAQ